MKLSELSGLLGLTTHQPQGRLDVEVSGAYTSDLLSDVMGFAKEKNVWLTCQTHENIVAVAKLRNLAAIILVNSHKPDELTLRLAQEENVILLSTSDSAFVFGGKLYNLLAKGNV